MLINPSKHKPFPLTESGQVNPLRWHILFKEEDGSYTSESGVFKCKDYFNDAVAWYNKVKLNVYGMDWNQIRLNDEGVYVHLTQLNHKTALLNNLGIIAKECEEQGLPLLDFKEVDDGILLFIPLDFFRNTYTISVLVYCIRISHCATCFTSFQDVIDNVAYKEVDNKFHKYYDTIMNSKFKAPIEVDDWGYVGKNYVGKLRGLTSYIIHNNGCHSWCYNVEIGI